MKRGLVIDNGGSESRYKPYGGELHTLKNDYAILHDFNSFRVKELEDPLSIARIVAAPKAEHEKCITHGEACRQYTTDSIGMRSGEKKTDSLSYYLQFIYMVARSCMEENLKSARQAARTDTMIDTADYSDSHDYSIVTLIPLREHAGESDCVAKMKSMLAGSYTVEFPLVAGDNTVKFNISANKLGVLPEDGVAIIGLKDIIMPQDYTLVIGLGHVTLDLALYIGKQLACNVKSEPHAGSTLISLIKDALADKGHYLDESMIGNVIETGKVRVGVREEDVSDIIYSQKSVFVSRYIKDDIIALLNAAKINPAQIQYVLPSGALFNDVNNTGDILNMIIDKTGLNNAEVKRVSEDMRYVNIQMADLYIEGLMR